MAETRERKTVLLVAARENDYALMRELLDACEGHFDLVWSADFEEALAIGRENCPDVCLVDYQLGDRDGLELLRAWRRGNCDVPAILLAGHGDREVDVEASQLGAADYLVKGRFDAADLERAIRYAGTQAAARRALRESALQNNRLAAAIDTLRAGVFLTDPQQPANPIVFHNKGLRELTGLTAAEISDHNFCELPGFDSGAVEIRRIQAALAEHKTHEGTLLHRRGDGREWWGQLLLQPLFDTSGALLNYIGVLTDASDHIRAEQVLRHYNRALHVSSQCRRVVARAATEDELLREICHIIVQAGGYPLAWAGLAVDDEGLVRPVAWAAAEADVLRAMRVSWDDEEQSAGPAGVALRTNQVQSIPDIAAFEIEGGASEGASWYVSALQRGFGSALVLPLAGNDGAFGVLCIYAVAAHAFDADETQLLGDLAADLSHGVLSLRARASHRRAEDALRASEEKFRSLTEHSLDVITLLNRVGTILYLSASVSWVFGHETESLLGGSFFDLLHPDDEPRLRAEFERIVEKFGAVTTFQGRLRRDDGEWRFIEGTLQNMLDVAAVQAMVANVRDITERKAVETSLRASEQSYRNLIEVSPDAILLFDRQGAIVMANQQAVRIFGYESAEEMRGLQVEALVAPEHARRAGEDRRRRMRVLDLRFIEYSLRRKDGSLFPGEVTASPAPGQSDEPEGLIAVVRDITERKQTEEQLMRNAFYDALTGLPNRALFTERIKAALNRVQRRPDSLFAVLVLDIDRFKNINDSLGHEYGDRLLIEVAQRLQASLREEDTVARLGGDEFAVLIEGADDESAALYAAERVHHQFAEPFLLDEYELFISVGIGITLSPTGYDSPDNMLRDADTAMYRAKWQGTGRHEVFDQAMHERVRSLLQVETDLRRAVEAIEGEAADDETGEGETGESGADNRRVDFLLHYQPIISLQAGRVGGFEALIRWRHPERGLIEPFDFIPIAEETGLIVPIGNWILREACRQARRWQQQFPHHPPLAINVNLSARQFLQLDLIEHIQRTLAETGIAPADLKLEITESVLMKNPDSAAAMLLQLRDLGVRLAIDDFGTGYSSLAYLRRFPIDGLKVDRSFVRSMNENKEDREIVRSIVALAHTLQLRVTAEGVESDGQFAQLRSLGCEYLQGYYFSRPLDAVAVTALLRTAPCW